LKGGSLTNACKEQAKYWPMLSKEGREGGWSVYSEFRKYMSKLVTLAAQSVADDKLVQPQLNLHSMVTLILPIAIKHNKVTQLKEIM
jgi:hypothetical protein